jgi:hypothetical protein
MKTILRIGIVLLVLGGAIMICVELTRSAREPRNVDKYVSSYEGMPEHSGDSKGCSNILTKLSDKAISSNSTIQSDHKTDAKSDHYINETSFRWNGEELSCQMEFALGIRKAQNQEERWSAIHDLGKTLPPHEIDALIRFLEDRTVGGPGEDIRGIKNDILEALIDQDPQPARIQEVILSMFRDKSHEEWWRNFCVQHFELLYRRKWSGGSAVSGDPARVAMADAYREALAETGNSIAGTALLGIARLSENYPEFDKKAVSKTAVQIAGDEHADPSGRIAALQVAGGLGGVAILPVARSVAASGSPVALRMAAVSAISEVGTQEDLPILSQINRADEAYLAKAARSALHRIELRIASGKK